ncbi:hypothetical protein BGZ54_008578 [Gamsiella multidivaricata]|nr:hypothetical protein BGZ54_008578 [Gamsiella multidivaricata]
MSTSANTGMPMMGVSDLESNLKLLEPGNSNEQKLIGLMMIGLRLKNSEDDLPTLKRFCDRMDFKFLDKMLTAKEDVVHPDTEVGPEGIRGIACDILYYLSRHRDLIIRKELVDRLPAMIKVVSPTDETENTKKIIEIMAKMAVYPETRWAVTNVDLVMAMFDYIYAGFDRKNTDKAHEYAEHIFRVAPISIYDGYEQDPFSVQKFTKDWVPKIMGKMAEPFSNVNEKHKPELLKMINNTMHCLPEEYMIQNARDCPNETYHWSRALKSGLLQILSTSTKQANGLLAQRMGMTWMFRSSWPVTKVFPKKRTTPASLVSSMEMLGLSDKEMDKKYTALVLQLTCVELRMLMDELGNQITAPPPPPKPKTTNPKEKKERNIRMEFLFPLALEVLEQTVSYLVSISEDFEEVDKGVFDASGVLKVQEMLQPTFTAILDYVLDLQTSKKGTPEILCNHMEYLACLKSLSYWLMEDDSLHARAVPLVKKLRQVLRHCKSKSSLLSRRYYLEPILERLDMVIANE